MSGSLVIPQRGAESCAKCNVQRDSLQYPEDLTRLDGYRARATEAKWAHVEVKAPLKAPVGCLKARCCSGDKLSYSRVSLFVNIFALDTSFGARPRAKRKYH